MGINNVGWSYILLFSLCLSIDLINRNVRKWVYFELGTLPFETNRDIVVQLLLLLLLYSSPLW